MPEFPSPERIIQDLNDLRPYIDNDSAHPRRGEVEAAEFIEDFARQWELGDVLSHRMRPTARFEPYIHQEPELRNVTIDVGTGTEEILFLHGHFDVVPPKDYGPYDSITFRQDETRPHIFRGLGSYDMLAGVAAILTALRNIKIHSRRRVRAVLVFGEENDSEGTHSALDQRNNLFYFRGARAAISTEIKVRSSIEDPYRLIVGRPGRVALITKILGEAKHAGDIHAEEMEGQTSERGSKVKSHLQQLNFRKHPHDTRNLMAPGNARVLKYWSEDPESLSSPGMETVIFNVHHAHPEEGVKELLPRFHSEIARVLGDDNFGLDQVERRLPWTEPWLEPVDNPLYPFPRRIQEIANSVTADKRAAKHVPFEADCGVADEGILHKNNIPVICVPPRGEHAHKRTESLDIRSIREYQVPVIQEAAALDRPLTHD